MFHKKFTKILKKFKIIILFVDSQLITKIIYTYPQKSSLDKGKVRTQIALRLVTQDLSRLNGDFL